MTSSSHLPHTTTNAGLLALSERRWADGCVDPGIRNGTDATSTNDPEANDDNPKGGGLLPASAVLCLDVLNELL